LETRIISHRDKQLLLGQRCENKILGSSQKCNITLQFFVGSTKIKQKGTWNFKIEDNHGTMHDILLPKILLALEAPYHLLSPQHWDNKVKTQMAHIA